MEQVNEIVVRLELVPHPEGGFYRETYRSEELIPAQDLFFDRFDGPRNCCTAIYFLLQQGQKSHLHRIKSDEIWHHYEGGQVCIVEVTPHGELKKTLLGSVRHHNSLPQYVVRTGNWFGAFAVGDEPYSLIGCTVAPGFDFADFEMADIQLLDEWQGEERSLLASLIR
jgi:predicted cupin superfamily sugar epimerase